VAKGTRENFNMITIYTDGSCFPNPGPGGWAAILEIDSKEERMVGNENNTTNNRMEIMPVLRSLQHIPPNSEVIVYSDSEYVVKTIGCWKEGKPSKNGWMVKWKENNWKRPNEPLKNIDLWKEIDNVVRLHQSVEMRWVRGHNNNSLNEQCDTLANEARKSL
jgi:ribonuclease HI